MPDDRLILDALTLPPAAVGYAMSAALARRWPGHHVLETEDQDLDLDLFLERVPLAVTEHPVPHPQRETSWDRRPGLEGEDEQEHALVTHLFQGHRTLLFEGQPIEAVTIQWSEGDTAHRRTWVAGADALVVERFLTRVGEVVSQVHDDEVMVFASGCWQRSRSLRAAIAGANFDDLVLPKGVAAEILADFRRFLAAREEYERYGVPWKRGTLFLGPPGNGKTHCVKALINALGLPCLYVQSFQAPYGGNPQRNVNRVFERARRTAPCVLVLEDLDTLVTDKTRSFFLNELDGFAANTGILTIATTNHAERLDASILDRPSRFDRKVRFDLPGPDERLVYLSRWNDRPAIGARLPAPAVEALVAATEGFSYAYLKELFVSSLVQWVSDGRTRPLEDVADAQARALRDQMTTVEDRDVRHVYVHDRWSREDDDE